MRWTSPLGVMAAIVAIGFVAHTLSKAAPPKPRFQDPVSASFERELNREPGPAKPVRRESVEQDVLYEMLNRAHWTQSKPNEGDATGVTENDKTEN